jgi:hypothetical protein
MKVYLLHGWYDEDSQSGLPAAYSTLDRAISAARTLAGEPCDWEPHTPPHCAFTLANGEDYKLTIDHHELDKFTGLDD